MSTNKPDLTRVWANSAPPANVVDPDTTTPGKVASGWQAEVPPFEHFNFLQQWFTQGLAHANEQGIMVWDTDTEYPLNGYAKGSDGSVYISLIATNQGNDPTSSPTQWKPILGLTHFDTVADMIAAPLKDDQVAFTSGHNAIGDGGSDIYRVAASTTEAGSFYKTLSNGKVAISMSTVIHPLQVGYSLDASAMTSIAIVDANWAILKDLINDLKGSYRQMVKFDNLLTLKLIHANWLSGTRTPIGFYSDSTTDGAKTTGHVPSTGSDSSPFAVTINESPNAYPAKLQAQANALGPAKTLATCYNGGFDSESYRSGFGLQHWYNVWFRGLAGSNVDWSDVAAIVLGFGTSDSANVDDTATVIADYSIDMECTIIDSFMRGVQPILQTPVLTTQHKGNGINGRNGDQSLTIINAVQNELKEKYGLEQLSYSDSFVEATSGFNSIQYGDLVSPAANDQVHPIDLGHRVHAGYILQQMNEQIVKVSDEPYNFFAGTPYYRVVDESINITDNVLTRAVTQYGATVQSVGEYFYKFAASAVNEDLLELHIYCARPTMLFYMPIKSTVDQPELLINSLTHDTNSTFDIKEAFQQPVDETFTRVIAVANLNYGLNRVIIRANSAGGQQLIGGFMTVPNDMLNLSLYRNTPAGTVKKNRAFEFRANRIGGFGAQDVNSLIPIWDKYMPADNEYIAIAFTLDKDLAAATDYDIYSHFNDLEDKGDCYNIFRFNSDTLTVFKVVLGVTTQVATVTTAGLGAALVAGANVMIRLRTRFFSSSDTNIQIHVDGTQITGTTVPLGDLWTTGYGLEMNTVQCHAIGINSIEASKGDLTNIV